MYSASCTCYEHSKQAQTALGRVLKIYQSIYVLLLRNLVDYHYYVYCDIFLTCLQNKKVVVFYGSQTGTAEEFASRLAKEATRHGLPAMTFDPEDCTDWGDLQKVGKEIENSLVIFCLATYGEGDPTDNAQELFNWVKEDNDIDLTGLK